MNIEELIGIREEDLSEAQRVRLAEHLADDGARDSHQQALDLGREIARLPGFSGGATASDVLHLAAQRRQRRVGWRGPTVGVFALAAAAVLWVNAGTPDTGTSRYRAVDANTVGSVHLEAAAESTIGLRALADGEAVGTDEAVLFMVTTSTPGHLVVFEAHSGDLSQVWPADGTGSWSVEAGKHTVGGEKPMGWRPDEGSGNRVYEVWLCANPIEGGADLVDGSCSVDRMVIQWEQEDQ